MKRVKPLCQAFMWSLTILSVLVNPNQVRAETEVSGPYFSDVTWTLAGSPYVLKGDVQVAHGARLTIEPGVVVRYTGPYEVLVSGAIIANGTAESVIAFSAADSGDQSDTTLLEFRETDLAVSSLSHVRMDRAGTAIKIGGYWSDTTNALVVSYGDLSNVSIDAGGSIIISNASIVASSVTSRGRGTVRCLDATISDSILYSKSYGYGISVERSIVRGSELVINNEPYPNGNIFIGESVIHDSSISVTDVASVRSGAGPMSREGFPGELVVERSEIVNTPVDLGAHGNMVIRESLVCCAGLFGIHAGCGSSIVDSGILGDSNDTGVGFLADHGYWEPDGAQGLIVSNATIAGFAVGVELRDADNGLTLVLRGNNIMGGGVFSMVTRIDRDVDAARNYWGTTDGAQIGRQIYDYYDNIYLGVIDYSDYLTAPNPDAPISPPVNVVKTSVAGGVRVSWSANPEGDLKGYRVYWGLKEGYEFEHVIDVGDVNEYTLPDLSANDVVGVTAYDMDADGTDDLVEGHESWYGHAAGDSLSYISTPSGVSASDGTYADKISVSWVVRNPVKGFEIWRGMSDDSACASIVGTSTENAFDDKSVSPATVYYYWVKATNSYALSAFSSSDSGWARVTYLPEPGGIRATDGAYENMVRVSWDEVAGAMSYEVWRGMGEDVAGAEKLTDTASTSFHDTSITMLVPGRVYYYWVRATSGEVSSRFSVADTGYAAATALFAPVNVSASDGTYPDKVRVTWAAVSGAGSYELLRGVSDDPGGAARVAELLSTAYDDGSVTPGETYYYCVRARNSSATSAMSRPDSGYASITDGGSADLRVSGVRFQPGHIWAGDHPAIVAFDLENLGPDDMVDPNTRVQADLYLSGNTTFGDSDDIFIGTKTADISLASGNSTNVMNPGRPKNEDVTIPPGLSGEYYVFVNVAHAAPSTLTDPNMDNSYAMREGSVVVRIHPSRHQVWDFDGDGKSDLAVYHEQSGTWFVRSIEGAVIAWGMNWGGPGFEPLTDDYDGDGRTDLGVYNRVSGCWFAKSISAGIILWGEKWGGPGLDPITGDFDGDGRTDMGAYNRNTGEWYVRSVAGSILAWAEAWGGSGFVAVRGDYDGDGKSDMGVYQRNTGKWFVRAATGSPLVWGETWGGPGMKAVPGDYDGDGQSDLMVYNDGSASWYARTISGNPIVSGLLYGGADLTSVPGDFDGNGATDLAMYHEQTGKWYIITAEGSVILWGAEWGGPGLKPVGGVE